MEEGAGSLDRLKGTWGYSLTLAPLEASTEAEKSNTEHDKLVLPNHELQDSSTLPLHFHSEPVTHGWGVDIWRQDPAPWRQGCLLPAAR